MTNNWMIFLILFGLGVLSGGGYLGLLWISVKKFSQQSQPIFWTISSFFIRLFLIGMLLFIIAKKFQIEGILFYLSGFFLIKQIVKTKMKKSKNYGYHS